MKNHTGLCLVAFLWLSLISAQESGDYAGHSSLELGGDSLELTNINLSNNAFVDGTHTSDLGIEQYVQAPKAALTPLLGRYE